ncbi:MAG TPA: hypothetical protein VGB00_18585 [Pyrinomonadaceae bacterium]
MYSNHIVNNIKRMAIILSLAFGVVLISDISAQAQYRKSRQTRVYIIRDDSRYDREYPRDYTTREYTNEGMTVAEQYGYEDGLEDGADAGRERDAYHPENSGDWQKGTNGYEDRFGSKKAYRQAYREAYLEGYREGYRRYTRRTYTNAENFRKRY